MRLRLRVQGIVQGVGFRPFVYRLATERALSGWVENRPDGVHAEVQGASTAVDGFRRALLAEHPAAARIDRLEAEPTPDVAETPSFHIRASTALGTTRSVLPADLAMCSDCRAEIEDPSDRRHGYAFTNCTACGPRYTIVEALPYDRARTSMKGFPMCADCAREYADPSNHRYHAEPVACPACGPSLRLLGATGDPLHEAAQALIAGKVLALKGLGGYQLLVDATSSSSVQLLRERKHRPAKPFAVMFPDLAALEASVWVSPAERDELLSARSPIVLLRARSQSGVCAEVAPGNPRIGAMLPYTPLHRLLLEAVARPVVCTSGNLSEEPMAHIDDEAQTRLRGLADLFLLHDRPIVRPVDDSVVRVDPGGLTILRRARGFAPASHRVSIEAPPVLALGGHEKNTVTLLAGGEAIVSQYLGDLSSAEGIDLLQQTIDDLLRFFQVQPERIACDLHPDYASTQLAQHCARAWNVPLVRVQHHHAHGLSCAAENGLDGPVLALTWDGTGYGDDGTLWGGEALAVDGPGYARVGALRSFPLPGGEAASREPRRSALGLLWELFGDCDAELAEAASWFQPAELRLLRQVLRAQLNAPRTSSIGRLFDAAAALCGIRWERGFDGQAAMALEFAADACDAATDPLPWRFCNRNGLLEADPKEGIRALRDRRQAGAPPGELAVAFHEWLAELAVAWAQHAGRSKVALSGGCFQNGRLASRVEHRLKEAGFQVFVHRAFPPNDGGLSLGQAVAAALSHRRGSACVWRYQEEFLR